MMLHHLQATQRLGEPGVVLSAEPSQDTRGNPVGTNSVFLPVELPGYRSQPMPVAQVVLDMLPKDTTFGQRHYVGNDGFWIDTSVVLMGADRSSIHKPQICLVGQGWKILKSTPIKVKIDRPHPYELPVMKLDVTGEVTLNDGQRTRLNGVFLYWFVSQNQLTSDHWDRQYWMARDLIQHGLLQRWAYVTYFAVCREGLEGLAFERVKNLIVAGVPHFQKVAGPQADLVSVAEPEAARR